jgi:hypothetical protein
VRRPWHQATGRSVASTDLRPARRGAQPLAKLSYATSQSSRLARSAARKSARPP